MRSLIQRTATTFAIGVGLAGIANANVNQKTEVMVTTDIVKSRTFKSENVYNLQGQIFVRPGATLTIEPGTVIASTTNGGGSLAVAAGGQIFAMGNKQNPIIFTSKADVATWINGNSKTGTWREGHNEWGNLTVMGRGYVSENAVMGNTAVPKATNVAPMEGMTAAFPGDTSVLYGGGDDEDDSGTIKYVSLRFGGKVIALDNELNGLSLGGIGRGTDIHHIDIMNNIDDGIEVWGGTVNLKYLNVWNIGDDSIDLDQGWRGKAQFISIVQGYSQSGSVTQGGGVGDNCFETDGAEQSDWQPVTTTTIYNVTAIGQPVSGDHATAWRDNARIQYRNCVFMDTGDRVVSFDNVDGDGGLGYGFGGTLSWAATWTTAAGTPSAVNPFDGSESVPPYQAQTSGRLAEITDSVFFRNLAGAAYTEANNRGVFAPANNNVLTPGSADADAPIQSITRGAPVVVGGLTMLPVIKLDPRAKNAATTSVAKAPADGFFTPVGYRGAFAPNRDGNWLCGWTAASAFGFLEGCPETPFEVSVQLGF